MARPFTGGYACREDIRDSPEERKATKQKALKSNEDLRGKGYFSQGRKQIGEGGREEGTRSGNQLCSSVHSKLQISGAFRVKLNLPELQKLEPHKIQTPGCYSLHLKYTPSALSRIVLLGGVRTSQRQDLVGDPPNTKVMPQRGLGTPVPSSSPLLIPSHEVSQFSSTHVPVIIGQLTTGPRQWGQLLIASVSNTVSQNKSFLVTN